jgi:hypothetical protein
MQGKQRYQSAVPAITLLVLLLLLLSQLCWIHKHLLLVCSNTEAV